MPDESTLRPSPQLRAALDGHRAFLDSDDDARDQAIQAADDPALRSLAGDVEPLFEEINSLLDRLVAAPHPTSPELEQLESDLNSLAQAAMEAQMALDDRAG